MGLWGKENTSGYEEGSRVYADTQRTDDILYTSPRQSISITRRTCSAGSWQRDKVAQVSPLGHLEDEYSGTERVCMHVQKECMYGKYVCFCKGG